MPTEPLSKNYFCLVDSCHPSANSALKSWKLTPVSEVNALPSTKKGQRSDRAVCSGMKKRLPNFRAEIRSVWKHLLAVLLPQLLNQLLGKLGESIGLQIPFFICVPFREILKGILLLFIGQANLHSFLFGLSHYESKIMATTWGYGGSHWIPSYLIMRVNCNAHVIKILPSRWE